ncbi:cytochrome C [Hyphomicrobium nitrativorans NL23]|uniref:Cytochrome C n=1 Tax=Hyphomicrobium nitrativorans NL23 TaxID=1029756 RepID=V5SD98_9HYPH|nr:c-type cytochrome [Hyphomicrobium nitrativorans]AHB48035.1 cytochrome C [Hyphomicrobium nitrativorans NL23]
MTMPAATLRAALTTAVAVSILAASAAGHDAEAQSPLEAIESTEKGELKNPHSGDAGAAEEGHKLYMAAGCNGCHGGTGGGGMGPPLSNQVWVYGDDDDTLFRLITLGSDDLQAAGYRRIGTEAVVGPMPHAKDIVKSADDMWKIVTWIKSLHEN